MMNVVPEPEFDSLLARYAAAGGVLDYVSLEPQEADSPYRCHRAAALAGMAEIDRRLEQWAVQNASENSPVDKFFRLRWAEAKLIGAPVDFPTFWGTDDVEPKQIGFNAWSIPTVDGYKTAFFHPPHSLRGSVGDHAQLFADINAHVLGNDPERAEIYSWSTDWSNYFEAGHEWWGAFFWTIRPADSQQLVVIGASTTD